MPLKDKWENLVDGASEITVSPINNIANSVIDIEEKIENIGETTYYYEKIETIELTEDTTVVERTQYLDGKPYNLRNVIIWITSKSGTSLVADKYILLDVYYGEQNARVFRNVRLGIENNAPTLTILKSESDGNFKRAIMSGSSTNKANAIQETTTMSSLNFVLTNNNINKIKLTHQTAMPKGTIIEIYGVKA